MPRSSIAVFGVGHAEGVGAAVARRFAREGFRTCVFGRNAAKLQTCRESLAALTDDFEVTVGDVTDDEATRAFVAAADREDAPLEVAVFNAGGNWPGAFMDLDPAFFEEMWRVNARSALVFAQTVLARMLTRERGTLLFTGATASTRGRQNFASFASAKAALRGMAQSCAREFFPRGIHVAHVVIDGGVDGDRLRGFLPGLNGMLAPDAIAENYWHLHRQPRSAWTHELDLRPFKENW